jgi:alpha-tubulin suppressor-like RCC1 family protein
MRAHLATLALLGTSAWSCAPAGEAGRRASPPAPPARTQAPSVAPAPPAPSQSRVAVGGRHTCAIRPSGGVACWGRNAAGQLGDGTLVARSTPVEVAGLAGAAQIAAVGDRTCVVTIGGEVSCWGGSGVAVPRAVPGLHDAVEVSMTGWHDCAVLRAGQVHCWGVAWLGNGRGWPTGGTAGQPPPSFPPVAVTGIDDAIAVAGSCVLRRTGDVACWGPNRDGEVGDGTLEPRAAPVPVVGLHDAVAVAAGGDHACALRRAGEVVCWGRADQGQLGDGVVAERSLTPVPVAGIEDGVGLAAGDLDTCVVRRGGEGACWGASVFGSPGGEGARVSLPVPDLHGAIEIAAGPTHACARLSPSGLVCWGDDLEGELGNGTAALTGTFSTVEGLTDAARVAVGRGFACAVRRTGDVACWGADDGGQLGDGTRKSRGVPAPVPGIGGVRRLDAFEEHACAVLATGAVACWGEGAPVAGEPGGADRPPLLPTTVAGIAGALDVSTEWHHTCALRRGGQVVCWGTTDGPCECGTTEGDPRRPAPLRGVGPAIGLSTSDFGGCAVGRTGALVCWGMGAIDAWEPSGGPPRKNPPRQEDLLRPTALRGVTDAAAIGLHGVQACLLRRSGRVDCWDYESKTMLPQNPLPAGAEVAGLADAKSIDRSLLVRATGEIAAPTPSPGGYVARPIQPEVRDAVSVSGTAENGCAVRSSGSVVCWGDDTHGQLGAGDRGRSAKPVRVFGFP